MKVGDLVKYRSYHTGLQGLVGCAVEFLRIPSGDRVRVLWPPKRRTCGIQRDWDWVEDLEVISEGR